MDRMRASSIIIFLSFFLVASTCSAIDIVKLLEKHSDFSTFSTALNTSKLADDINNHGSSITVLAVANHAASALNGLSPDDAKKLLSTHVLLDYFDEPKLKGLVKKDNGKPTTVVTMLQTTGEAQHQQGMVNVGVLKGGEVAFGSAVHGGGLDSKYIKSVTAQPYNISVLQVTSLIEIPDISPGAAPKAAPPAEDDSVEEDDAAAPSSEDEISEDDDATAPSPDEGSEEESELSSPPVSGDAPTEAPEAAKEKKPEKSEHAEPPAPSAASKIEMALGAGLVMALASLFA